MELKWPQQRYSCPRKVDHLYIQPMVKPSPLSPRYYERYEKYKLEVEAIHKDLEIANTKVQKAEKDLTEAEKNLTENRWSKANSKLALIQRLKNDYAQAKKSEQELNKKLDMLTDENKNVIDIIALQESMETIYRERIARLTKIEV